MRDSRIKLLQIACTQSWEWCTQISWRKLYGWLGIYQTQKKLQKFFPFKFCHDKVLIHSPLHLFPSISPSQKSSSEDDASSVDGELQIDESVRPDDMDAEMYSEMEPDSLADLPVRVKNASSRSDFVTQMRPFLWVKYPSATSAEINSMINAKWNMLREVRKEGHAKPNYEIKSLGGPVVDEQEEEGEEEMGGRRSTRRRAAKNLARNAYTLDLTDEIEYADSPASSNNSKEAMVSGSSKKHKQQAQTSTGSGRGRKRGRRGIKRTDKTGPRVPPMKIKMIGRSGESDSPIFFAESVESWDEASDSEQSGLSRPKAARVKELQALDSETSSLVFEDRDEDSTQVSASGIHTLRSVQRTIYM